MEYKVLTLWQPWASLLVYGAKKIETRPKPTTWTAEKGTYLIHAASKWDYGFASMCLHHIFQSELVKIGLLEDKEYCDLREIKLPLGQIIGAIEVTECQKIIYNNSDDFVNTYAKLESGIIVKEPEEFLGDYRPGRYAWLTQNPRILKNPIPYKGGQGYYVPFNGNVNDLQFL